MTPSLLFWIYAWIVLAAAVGLATLGWRAVRSGRIERHRTLVDWAIRLIVVFVVSYAAKLAVLGREDLSHWTPVDLWTLRIHEVFIAIMLVCGAVARVVGRRAAAGAGPLRQRHRWFGRVAVLSALGALVFGTFVLAGMFVRSGLP